MYRYMFSSNHVGSNHPVPPVQYQAIRPPFFQVIALSHISFSTTIDDDDDDDNI
jgi:hypothetical protein